MSSVLLRPTAVLLHAIRIVGIAALPSGHATIPIMIIPIMIMDLFDVMDTPAPACRAAGKL